MRAPSTSASNLAQAISALNTREPTPQSVPATRVSLPFGRPNRLPHPPLVVVAWVGGLDRVHLGPDLEHEVDDVLEREVVLVRAVTAAPAHVQTDLLLGNIAQGVVQR